MQQRIHRKKTPFGTVLVYIVLDSAFHPPAPLGSQLVPDAFG